MTILVTGSAGFIGSHVTQALLARGERVIGLDNLNDYYAPSRKQANLAEIGESPNWKFVEGDIRDAETLRALFAAERPDKIIHLAAMPGIPYSMKHPLLYEDVNTRGTLNLLEMAREFDVKKFVLASTSSIYGETDKIPFVETDPTDKPLAPYPATKKACEVLVYTYHHLYGLQCAVLRFFNVYGPRGRPDMTPCKFAEAIAAGREFTLYDEGRPRRDWTFIRDIVSGILAAADADMGYEIFNLGRGQPVLMRDFVTILEKLVGKPARWKNAPLPPTDLPVTFADTTKAQRMLGYSPRVSIEEGLTQFWNWYQSPNLKSQTLAPALRSGPCGSAGVSNL
jgi:UDP-glucuronate 4-epimerase